MYIRFVKSLSIAFFILLNFNPFELTTPVVVSYKVKYVPLEFQRDFSNYLIHIIRAPHVYKII